MKDHKVISLKFIDPGIDLSTSGIHNGTYNLIRAAQIIGKPMKSGHMDQRLRKRKPQPLCRCRADTQTRKRPWPRRYRYSINAVKVKFNHLRHFMKHWQQRLRMGLLIIHRILRNRHFLDRPRLHHRNAGNQPGTVHC